MNTTVVNVLLVEDNPADARLVERRLDTTQQIECVITHAQWLSSGLTLAKNRSFDIVLLDLSLPDSSGIDTVIAMRRELPTTPVIVLSAQEDLNVSMRSLEAGADNFIVKRPEMTTEELERQIVYSLERSRRQNMSKTLMQRSIQNLSLEKPGAHSTIPPIGKMAASHVTQIDDTMSHVRLFLQRNNPAIAEQVEHILHNRGYYISIQELRSLLRMDENVHNKKTVPLSERAITAIRDATAPAGKPDRTLDPESELMSVLKTLGGTDE